MDFFFFFLKQSKSKAAADHLLVICETKKFMCNVSFLADVFSSFECSRSATTGEREKKMRLDMVEKKLVALGNKLDLFQADFSIREAAALQHPEDSGCEQRHREYEKNSSHSRRRISLPFSRDVIEFVRDPFTISPGR